jgi:hypothetical protein
MQFQNSTMDGIGAAGFAVGKSMAEDFFSAVSSGLAGTARYSSEFFIPFILSATYFNRVERQRLQGRDISESMDAYLALFQNNIDLICRSMKGTSATMARYASLEMDGFIEAVCDSCAQLKLDKLSSYMRRQAKLLEMVTWGYPNAIDAIEPEFGFHFERGEHPLVDETDRFLLYRVAPSRKQVETREGAKPVLIIPPYVLGANILGFLPGEERSYAHCFSNLGYPTYIRILKDIKTSIALQKMTGEDDATDTRRFCETILKKHGKQVTLNGYCQGGFNSLCTLLTGELDSLVDAFITCVSPIDGTRSKDLAAFLQNLHHRFNDLAYGSKILPNGNTVADGTLMGWVYKLKSIEHEIPAVSFFRDLAMFARQKNGDFNVSKTAAALNYWLQKERNDLPLEITRMSFASYNTPITKDGVLPVRLFGKKLEFKRLKEKKIPWLICYGTQDNMVEKETALAALDHVEAEVTPFPKGHVAIATSWSFPTSLCALHTRFGSGQHRGPVRFHMDLDQDLEDRQTLAVGTEKTPSRSSETAPPHTPKTVKTAPMATRPKKAIPKATAKKVMKPAVSGAPEAANTTGPRKAPKVSKPRKKSGPKISAANTEKKLKTAAPKKAPKVPKSKGKSVSKKS